VELRLKALTLMIMTSVDWKREGFSVGFKTDALDWNDWKSPLMSQVKAKLLRKGTYWMLELKKRMAEEIFLALDSILQY
jgi:hypothetical protein